MRYSATGQPPKVTEYALGTTLYVSVMWVYSSCRVSEDALNKTNPLINLFYILQLVSILIESKICIAVS